jgi:protein-tyrosine phosphatase
VIDLHCHLLPGIDDGARDLDDSVAMARAALAGGVEAIVATPHVSGNYPNEPLALAGRVAQVQDAIDEAGVPLHVHQGAEIASSMLADLSDEQLRACALGGGRYVLLEPPYSGPAPFLDRLVFELARRGLDVVLAHPERIQAFHQHPDQLEKLVEQGALCSVTAGSVTGRWGRHVKDFTRGLFERGLVHNLASDAHDAQHRSPALAPQIEEAVAELPELADWVDWLCTEVPRAIVSGEPVSGVPPRIEPRRGLLGRLRRR